MKYFKISMMWLGFFVIASACGEYAISRPVNGFIQFLCVVGVAGLLIYLINETISIIKLK